MNKQYFTPIPANNAKVGKPGFHGANQLRKRRKMSATPGKIKCSSCQATWQQRGWAKRSRSYKDDSYPTICAQMNRKSAGDQVKG